MERRVLNLNETIRVAEMPGLPDQLLMLRRRWRIVLEATALVVILACLALARVQINYTATGVLLYDPANATVPGGPQVPAPDAASLDAATASQGAEIASLPMARALIAQLRLDRRVEFNPALKTGLLHRRPGVTDPARVVGLVRRALNVAVVPNSRILTVSFTSDDADVAAAAANSAMSLYLEHERDQQYQSLIETRGWLERNAAALASGLDKTEAALAAARAAAGVVPGAQASLTTETASHLAASLVEAQADLAMNQARLDSAAHGQSAAADAAIAPNLLPLRKDQADLSAQVQSLSGEYGPDYPPLRAARASLAAISGEINDETGRELAAAQGDVAADQAEIATLQAALATARTQSQAEDQESAPLRALEQQADAGRDMLRDITLQADQLAQAAALVRPDARIISAAAPPESPSTPHRSLLLVAATGLGLCFGLLLAALADALDTSFRDGEGLREILGLNCLALVPQVRDTERAALRQPFSIFAEQMRSLRTGLGVGTGAGPVVVAVTAARPGEGKTTVAVALARALAAAGLAVVAVDGDVRRPGFGSAFRLPAKRGLTDLLAGRATLDEVVAPIGETGLEVIAAGGRTEDALSLFLSPALDVLINKLRVRYDVVVLDVPPALALAESRVLARRADAALLCVRWGHTPRRVVLAAVRALREAEVKLAGAALTRVDATAHGRAGYADSEIYQDRYAGYFKG